MLRAPVAQPGDALIEVAGDCCTLNLPLVTLYWTTIEGKAVKVEKKQ